MSQPKFKNSKLFDFGDRKLHDGKPLIGEPQKLILDDAGYAAFEVKRKAEIEAEAAREKQRKEDEKQRFIDQFAEFKIDNSYLSDYDQFVFPKSEVLVRIFRVVDRKITAGKTEGGLYIPEAVKEGLSRITSYAKIIKTGQSVDSNVYSPGSLVKVTDHIMGTSPNPDYNALARAYNERGTGVDLDNLPDLKDVPMYVSNLIDWDQHNFRINITEYTDEDALTYLIPVSYIHAIIKD